VAQPLAPASRKEQNAAVIYAGQWFSKTGATFKRRYDCARPPNSGIASESELQWHGRHLDRYRDEWSGIAQVYVDGALTATVDTYLSPAQAQTPA